MPDVPVAIVTGGTRGIGRAISVELARLHFNVVVNHVSPHGPRVVDVVREMEALETGCLAVQADISQAEDRSRLLEATLEAFGRCDLLVNNAGIAPEVRVDLLETTAESYERVMNTNLKGPFFLTQLVASRMLEQREQEPETPFRIINIGSISAYTSSTSRGEYSISKAGLGMVTQLFADRLAGDRIGVYEIRPGITATDMTATVQAKYDQLIADGLTPLRRWGQPTDVAAAVAAIAEGKLDFSTGEVINVDGGFHLRRL